jgi:hypothetical protein
VVGKEVEVLFACWGSSVGSVDTCVAVTGIVGAALEQADNRNPNKTRIEIVFFKLNPLSK